MNIMEDSQRKWCNNEGALLKENLRGNCSILGSGVKRASYHPLCWAVEQQLRMVWGKKGQEVS